MVLQVVHRRRELVLHRSQEMETGAILFSGKGTGTLPFSGEGNW